MPYRSRHRLSLLRLVRGKALLWPAWALALLLVLSNGMAGVAPLRMLAATALDRAATQHATATTPAMAQTMAAMPHHHHAGVVDTELPAAPAAHGNGCPCCDDGHCDCLQVCKPLPQIAVALADAPLHVAAAPAPMQVAAATSIVDTPPLRPPIA